MNTEPVTQQRPQPLIWYFRTHFVLIALFSVGPFAMPLIWLHPRLSRTWKILITIIVFVLSLLLMVLSAIAVEELLRVYRELLEELQ